MPRATPSRRRPEDRERRRAQILEAATGLFAKRGVENVTFGDIARKTRLSRPLIYFYFPDQRTLFLEAVLRAHTRLLTRFEAAIAAGKTGLDQIENIGRAYAAFHLEEPDAFQVCTAFDARPALPADGDDLTRRLVESESRLHGLCVQALENGRCDGSIRTDIGQAAVLGMVLWGCVHGLAQLAATRGDVLRLEAGLTPAACLDAGFVLLRTALRSGS